MQYFSSKCSFHRIPQSLRLHLHLHLAQNTLNFFLEVASLTQASFRSVLFNLLVFGAFQVSFGYWFLIYFCCSLRADSLISILLNLQRCADGPEQHLSWWSPMWMWEECVPAVGWSSQSMPFRSYGFLMYLSSFPLPPAGIMSRFPPYLL